MPKRTIVAGAFALAALGLVSVVPPGSDPYDGPAVVHQDEERAEKLGRPLQRYEVKANVASMVLKRPMSVGS